MGVQVKELQALHREILRLHINHVPYSSIANELGITEAMVCYTVNSDLGKLALNRMQDQLDKAALEVNEQLYSNAKIAEQFLGRVVSGDEEVTKSLRAKVCMDQLDRAGFGKVTKTVNVDIKGQLTEEDLMEIKQQAYTVMQLAESDVQVSNG